MSIVVAQPGKGARRLDRTTIRDESYLQKYIYEHPDTLPLQELKDDLKLLILAREYPTASGPIDALGIDADGDIYLIETKLYKNPDKRLVVAQILDYGASLWRASEDPSAFLQRLDEAVLARSGQSLSSHLSAFYSLDGAALSDLVDSMQSSASAGRFHFVVLMDRLDDRLKDLISYINANSSFNILGVGLDFYQFDGTDILIPTLFGADTPKAARYAGSRRGRWDSVSFFADAARRVEPAAVEALRALFAWASSRADEVSWGTGVKTGSFSAKFTTIDPRSVFSAYSNGELCLNFKWLNSTAEASDWASRFGTALRNSGLVDLPEDYRERFVYLPADAWVTKETGFVQQLEKLLPPLR